MDNGFSREPMLDIFIWKTMQNIEQLRCQYWPVKGEPPHTDTVNEVSGYAHH